MREPLLEEDAQLDLSISFGRLAFTGGGAACNGFSQLASTALFGSPTRDESAHWGLCTAKLVRPHVDRLEILRDPLRERRALRQKGRRLVNLWHWRATVEAVRVELQPKVVRMSQLRMNCIEAHVRNMQIAGLIRRLVRSLAPQLLTGVP